MSRLFRFRNLLILLTVVFFVSGGYLGYLSALVDLDEVQFIEQVKAMTDRDRLEKQLARAKSILDARSRAYLRRSQEFIRKKQEEAAIAAGEKPETVEEAKEVLMNFQERSPILTPEEQVVMKAFQEEQEDLTFFQDEVKVIEEVLARQPSEEEINLFLASDRARRRISDNLRQLFLILDKRRELAQQRQQAKDGYQYWEQNPQSSPGWIDITVYNKDQGQRDINPLHVTQISTGLSIMPQGFDQRLRNLYIVYGDPNMRRGMSGVGVVFMKGEEVDFFRVLVHEFGHAWDLHREVNSGEKSPFYDGEYRLYSADPSVQYYQLSWANNYDRTADLEGFASTYGMSDPFEDFAEAFALYVMQNETFSTWQRGNSVLAKKYDFFQGIFHDRVFRSSKQYFAQPYDVTMLYVDYSLLLETGG